MYVAVPGAVMSGGPCGTPAVMVHSGASKQMAGWKLTVSPSWRALIVRLVVSKRMVDVVVDAMGCVVSVNAKA